MSFLRLMFSLGLILLAQAVFAQTDARVGLDRFLQDIDTPDNPINVGIGVEITQITGVDQKAENFSVVARLQMNWSDPGLSALVPPGRSHHTMLSAEFVTAARDAGLIVPSYIFENQQTRGYTKQSHVVVTSQGNAIHMRDEILTLQAPDFEFSAYPFDEQVFYLRVRSLSPTEFVTFQPLDEFSGLGPKLGEEEWVIDKVWTEIQKFQGSLGLEQDEYVLAFTADRHLIYYWTRIFLPMLLLVGISWANLFLEEYRRRIDIASGNLLAFIALNFTIANELPRLGYVTFLDAFLTAMFILSALAVAYNVYLRRLSVHGRDALSRRIDWHITIWGYPLLYIIVVGSIMAQFDLSQTIDPPG